MYFCIDTCGNTFHIFLYICPENLSLNIKKQNMKKLFVALLLTSMSLITALAQDIDVRGTVVSSSDGEPLLGVSVKQEGNPSNGIVTNTDGVYTIKVPADATLTFSYVGFAQILTA